MVAGHGTNEPAPGAGGAGGGFPRPAWREDPHAVLGPSAYLRIRDALWRGEGMDLDVYRPAFLARRLRSRIHARSVAPAEYADLVERDPVERLRLAEAIGVNVSTFFRDPPVWAFLEGVALEEILERREGPRDGIRSLSLGCAGGQEAYSLAMLLAEATRGRGINYLVDAHDVDPEAVALAEAAAYDRRALDPVASAARERYFARRADGTFVVRPALRSRVNVRRRNALAAPLGGPYEIVLCRNVMIYVEPAARARLLRAIGAALSPGGLLVLGQSEALLGEAARGYRVLSPRHRVYRKEEE